MNDPVDCSIISSDIRFRSLYENSFDAVLLSQPDGSILSANPAACRLFGMIEDEIVKAGRAGIIVFNEKAKLAFKERERTGKAKAELTFKRKDGSTFEGEVTSSLFTDNDGIVKTSLIIRDITERKKAEEMLRSSEERYRSLFEQAGDYILVLELPKVGVPIIRDVNSAALKVHGYSRDELIGKPMSLLDKQIDDDKTKRLIEKVSSGELVVFEVTHQRKDGTFFNAEASAKAIKLGSETWILSVERDITERKKVEGKLRQSDMIFENSLDMLCIAGFDGYFKVLNPAWSRTLGWSKEELLSKPWVEFVHPEDKEATNNIKANIVDGQEVFQFENRYFCKDGRIKWLSWNSYPYPKEKIMFGIARDITASKEAEYRLAVVNEKLRVTGSLTRHDVRNKFVIVKSSTYLLRKHIGDNPELAKYLESVDSAIDASNRLFEFSSIYEKIGAEARSKINVGQYFTQATMLLHGIQTIKITNECDGLTVMADSLIRQLFYNLLDNSLKHGQKVTYIRLHFNKEGKGVKLFYEDDGVGISQANKMKLFNEGFTTGKGSGLGLKLIKKMVEAFGWTITEEGEAGKGVKFVLTIPHIIENEPYD